MRTSVVILTRDRPQDLLECLDSLGEQTLLPDEVVVLDNSSDNVTSELIEQRRASLPFKLLYMEGHPELGTATGRNKALAETSGEAVFFLDDDFVLTDEPYLGTMLEVFQHDADGEIGGVAAPAGPLNPANGFLLRLRFLAKILFLLDSPRPGTILPSGFRSEWPRTTTWVKCLPGGGVAYRREVFAHTRFDAGYELIPYAMAEDQDFSYGVGRRWKLLWLTETQAWHKKSLAGHRATQYELYASIVRNHYHFMRKNLGRPWNYLAFWWAMLGVFLSCVLLLGVRPSRAHAEALAGFLQEIKVAARGSISALSETR